MDYNLDLNNHLNYDSLLLFEPRHFLCLEPTSQSRDASDAATLVATRLMNMCASWMGNRSKVLVANVSMCQSFPMWS